MKRVQVYILGLYIHINPIILHLELGAAIHGGRGLGGSSLLPRPWAINVQSWKTEHLSLVTKLIGQSINLS